jgi:hypothetical protein
MDEGIARRRRERGEKMPTETGPQRNGWGIGALWRRLPLFVRQLSVAGSLVGMGVVVQDRLDVLQDERVTYKALVDTLGINVHRLEGETRVFLPFARYVICSTERQSAGLSNDGCERSLIETSLWAVFLEERRRGPIERKEP